MGFRGLKKIGLNVLFLIALSGVFSTPALAVVDAAHLKQTWVASDGQIDPSAFDRLIEVMQQDVETNQLLKDVAARLGASDPVEIMKILKLCDENNSNLGTFYHTSNRFERIATPGADDGWDASTEQAIKNGVESKIVQHGDRETALVLTDVSICIKPNLTLLDSFTTFVHELTHFRGYQLLSEDIDILSYANEEDFIQQELFRSGGEFEAFSAEYRALKRINKKVPPSVGYVIEKFFDNDGNVEDRAGLAQYILNDMNYRENFQNKFRNAVVHEYNHMVNRYNSDQKNRQILQGNEKVYQDAIDYVEAYLDQARQGGYPANLLQDAEQKLSDSQQGLKKTATELKALDGDSDDAKYRMDLIQTRYGSFFAQ